MSQRLLGHGGHSGHGFTQDRWFSHTPREHFAGGGEVTDGQQGGQVTEVFRKAAGRAVTARLAEAWQSVFSMEVKCVCVCVYACPHMWSFHAAWRYVVCVHMCSCEGQRMVLRVAPHE